MNVLNSHQLPETSQINPFTFEEEYKKASADGDPVLVIVMSSELSGTYQSAVTAALYMTVILLSLKRSRSTAPSEPMPVPERLLQLFSGHDIRLEKYRDFYYDAFRM